MKNRLSILSASFILLISCVERNIVPTPPDEDASSARKNYYKFSPDKHSSQKPHELNLKNANLYLDGSFYYLSDNGDIRNVIVLYITDGYAKSLHKYVDYTYQIAIPLISATDLPVEHGDFLLYKKSHLTDNDYGSGLWYDNRALVGSFQIYNRNDSILRASDNRYVYRFDGTGGMDNHPAYVDEDDFLNIQGKISAGEQVTITIKKSTMMTWFLWDYANTATSVSLGNASLNFTGIIQDVSKLPITNGRTSSNQDLLDTIKMGLSDHN